MTKKKPSTTQNQVQDCHNMSEQKNTGTYVAVKRNTDIHNIYIHIY